MQTLAIYDLTGRIIFQAQGNVLEPEGLPFIWVDIPEGKLLKRIDVTSEEHIPVIEDIPKPQIEIIQEAVASLQTQVTTLSEKVDSNDTEIASVVDGVSEILTVILPSLMGGN